MRTNPTGRTQEEASQEFIHLESHLARLEPHIKRGEVGFRQEVRPQEIREHSGINRIGFNPRGGDRFTLSGFARCTSMPSFWMRSV